MKDSLLIELKLIHKQGSSYTSRLDETLTYCVFNHTDTDWVVLAAADSFKQTKSRTFSCCKNKSVFPHTLPFKKNIPLVPLLNIIADPFRGGVFYMPCLS